MARPATQRELNRAKKGNTRTVPERFRLTRRRIGPHDPTDLNALIRKAITVRLKVALGKADRLDRRGK